MQSEVVSASTLIIALNPSAEANNGFSHRTASRTGSSCSPFLRVNRSISHSLVKTEPCPRILVIMFLRIVDLDIQPLAARGELTGDGQEPIGRHHAVMLSVGELNFRQEQ